MNARPIDRKTSTAGAAEDASPRQGRGAAAWWKPAAAALVLAALLLAAKTFDVAPRLQAALEWIARLGPGAPVAFAALYLVVTVALLPAWLLTLGGGVVFGVVKGVAIVSVSATLGAAAAFLIGRHFAREWISRKLAGNARFRAIDDAVAREGWKIVLLVRLSPVLPFTLLNYAFGLTRVPFAHYVLASWIGMLPGTAMYVYVGSLAGSLAALGPSGRSRTPAEWALFGVGLVATAAVTAFVTRLARRALAKQAHLEGGEA